MTLFVSGFDCASKWQKHAAKAPCIVSKFHQLGKLSSHDVCSILQDGQDASQYSLKQVKDSPAEWCRRGINLLDNKLYGELSWDRVATMITMLLLTNDMARCQC